MRRPWDRPQGTSHIDHTKLTIDSYRELRDTVQQDVIIDGKSLNISRIVAVAKHGSIPLVTNDKDVLQNMQESVALLNAKLAEGLVVYGVNTGFGGSADVRTNNYEGLQKALIQSQNSAVILPGDKGQSSTSILDSLKRHSMPSTIVKAAMLIRSNSLIRGHSAVRQEVVRHILKLLSEDLTPVVPLRGSISASGDLAPLSYIAGVLEGNPDIFVDAGKGDDGEILSADQALARAGIPPLEFQPKEGLGLLNGTAFSAGAASIVIFEANQLALLSQLTTAMCTEALMGSRRSFHPFIAQVRPHAGQTEAATNIFTFLGDSKLATDLPPEKVGLAQDRYAIRTSSQWIGPHLENLAHASQEIQCELNSTTDNPLIDVKTGELHNCGNFQASSVTSAMEKTMSAMQGLGKMVFSQCSEVINPAMNKGLPPNLCIDDPSLSFTLKGVDINMASYMSELAYIAHPVSNFVHSAEMHNQGINSLAFIGARYAADTVELLSLMLATHLYVLCQALDIRTMCVEFEVLMKDPFDTITMDHFTDPTESGERFHNELWKALIIQWNKHTTHDLNGRAHTAVTAAIGTVFEHMATLESINVSTAILNSWKTEIQATLVQKYNQARTAFLKHQTTRDYLCGTSRLLYVFVRDTLGVPMHKGLVDHPTYVDHEGKCEAGKKTIGSNIGVVYAALRQGEFMDVLISCWDIHALNDTMSEHPNNTNGITAVIGTKRKHEQEDLSIPPEDCVNKR
ncbi:phenylalanine ammonia-lyase [Penicillium angulare]|uniref:Phenylalanine ammonia-lyase n=1 Tax=Penicillium angulare TaxID=116970 RepID=A0A9W9KT16_9EURO|nr:phenylalanine ammonia-lyase [Penicillium angulare]